jgi:hypothetical protein
MPKARRPSRPPPKLLSGGNPQIARAEGDAPVQAWINALEEWKPAVARRLDKLIVKLVPNVKKAVKWNSPFYGIEGKGWFLGVHAFTNYLKVMFFRGTAMKSVPPGGKQKHARWVDIHWDDFDEEQLTVWIKQASKIPGWNGGTPKSGGVAL